MPLARAPELPGSWRFTDAHGSDSLLLAPERGGLLCGWRSGDREILYFDAQRFADPTLSVRGGVPVLFPICGNLPNNRLPLPQGTFPLPQHGFARTMPWSLEELAGGDVIVAATGVTDGALLQGVRFRGNVITTETIIYRSLNGTVRRIHGEHRQMSKFHLD